MPDPGSGPIARSISDLTAWLSTVDASVWIVFAIVALVWGIILLIGSIPAIVKAVRSTATG